MPISSQYQAISDSNTNDNQTAETEKQQKTIAQEQAYKHDNLTGCHIIVSHGDLSHGDLSEQQQQNNQSINLE